MSVTHGIRAMAVLAVLGLATTALAAPPALTDEPKRIEGLIYARQFTLAEPHEFAWSSERPRITEGTILILDVDPDLVYPRQTAEPVLYVGSGTAQRINNPYPSGRLIAIVPGHVDLGTSRIWFGSPDLPERVDRAQCEDQRRKAIDAGIVPPDQATILSATERGGAPLALADVKALDGELRRLFQEFVER